MFVSYFLHCVLGLSVGNETAVETLRRPPARQTLFFVFWLRGRMCSQVDAAEKEKGVLKVYISLATYSVLSCVGTPFRLVCVLCKGRQMDFPDEGYVQTLLFTFFPYIMAGK